MPSGLRTVMLAPLAEPATETRIGTLEEEMPAAGRGRDVAQCLQARLRRLEASAAAKAPCRAPATQAQTPQDPRGLTNGDVSLRCGGGAIAIGIRGLNHCIVVAARHSQRKGAAALGGGLGRELAIVCLGGGARLEQPQPEAGAQLDVQGGDAAAGRGGRCWVGVGVRCRGPEHSGQCSAGARPQPPRHRRPRQTVRMRGKGSSALTRR